MIHISIQDNLKEFTRKLTAIQAGQIPFATSRALNDTAIKAQQDIIISIQISFQNLKKWWIKGNRRTGIRVEFSHKKNWPLTVSIYSSAYFAQIQEEGGSKQPRSGRALAVPTDKTPKSLRKSTGVRTARQKPQIFVDKRGVFRRMGRQGKRLKMLFSFTHQARVTPRFKFMLTAKTTTNRWFGIYFQRRLRQALANIKL